MEYFFVLELLRPFLIWQFLSTPRPSESFGRRVRRSLLAWAPYLAVLVANILWRLFIFNNQIYQPTLLSRLQAAPLSTVLDLLTKVLRDLYRVSAAAWAPVFHFPNAGVDGPRSVLFYLAVVFAAALLIGVFLFRNPHDDDAADPAISCRRC